MRITPEHEAHYVEHGYAVVENFCTPEELAGALDDFEATVPGWVDYIDNPEAPKPETWNKPFPGQRGIPHFPYKGDTLNDLSFHPELRRFALLQTGGEAVYCEQSHLSYKALDHRGDMDQYMHLDYTNHTLAYPPDVPRYWQTAFLFYFSDVTPECGPIAICSKQHYAEPILWPAHYKREDRPSLYENEVKIVAPAGSLIIYSMRTFHRGTKIFGNSGRLGMFVTYAPIACRWMGIVGWSLEAPRAEFTAWIERAGVDERTAIGFPAPGDPYWTDETRAGVAARYPRMDMSPYT